MSNCVITDSSLIDQLLDQCPSLAEVFNAHGMACVGCVFSRFHSIADAAVAYHLDAPALRVELTDRFNVSCDSESNTQSV